MSISTQKKRNKDMKTSDGIIVNKVYTDLDTFIHDISYNGYLYKIWAGENLTNYVKGEDSLNKYIFRGESSDKYKLIPSVLRDMYNRRRLPNFDIPCHSTITDEWQMIQQEYEFLKKFFWESDYNGLHIPNVDRLRLKDKSDDLFSSPGKWLPNDFFELAGLAQHYGVPTRLLDWSQDIFVALYFAVSGTLKLEKQDSPKDKESSGTSEQDNQGQYMVLWALNATWIESFPQKPLKIIIPPYNSNPNLCAQKGLFTLWQIDKHKKEKGIKPLFPYSQIKITPLDELIEKEFGSLHLSKTFLYRIRISRSLARDLYIYLRSMSYDASKLFPGYYGVAKSMQEDEAFRIQSKEFIKKLGHKTL